MAKIRIVETWLRSPASPPSHQRTVMVVTEKWAEQRVLMRAYADSRDQLHPTITLYGVELAIGPAGLDVNGPWSIHVPPGAADGRAQELVEHLHLAARRLAGAKGNPPRLADESSRFELEPTGHWAPDKQPRPVGSRSPTNPTLRVTPVPRARGNSPPVSNKRTAVGYQSGAGAQSAVMRLGLRPQLAARLGRFVDRIVPTDFQITTAERDVLNLLGERDRLDAREIGQLVGAADPVGWMEALVTKLESFGIDIVEPGDPRGPEPTYRLKT